MALGSFAIYKIRDVSIGTFTDPGPGLFPLLLGIILLIFSAISLFSSNLEKAPEISERIGLRNVFYMLAILLFFRICLPIAGYTLTTFLMFVFMIKVVGGRKWLSAVVWSALFTASSYFVFIKWLLVRFPTTALPF